MKINLFTIDYAVFRRKVYRRKTESTILIFTTMQKPDYIKLTPTDYNKWIQDEMLKRFVAIITHSDRIVLNGYEMVVNDSSIPLRVGESVYLQSSLGKTVFLEYKKEVDDYEAFLIAEKARKITEGIENRKLGSEAFWASYSVPFKYSLEIKEVLSGLSERSHGNGINKATVFHLYLHEGFHKGKLKRKSNSFLCSETSSKFGANWSNTLGNNTSENDIHGIRNVVSCKKCLQLMQKFKIEQRN